MENNLVKRKKINLWLLVLIVLFILSFIFTIVHIFNNSRANTELSLTTETDTFSNQNTSTEEDYSEIEEAKKTNGSAIGQIHSYTEFYDIESVDDTSTQNSGNHSTVSIENNTAPTQNTQTNQSTENQEANNSKEKTLELNNHKYVFSSDKSVSIQNEASKQYVQLDTKNYILKANTDTYSYSNLKSNNNLKDFLQDRYGLNITSKIKTGNVENTDLIICTISEENKSAYFIVVPLNKSEILYCKLYNAKYISNLIDDLGGPLTEILSIKTNIK